MQGIPINPGNKVKVSYKFNLMLENLPARKSGSMNSNFEYKMQISFNDFISNFVPSVRLDEVLDCC